MTFKEFKEIIEMSCEYKVEVFEGHSVQTVFVFNSKGSTMCRFWGNSNFALDTIYADNDEFLKEHWDTICEFAKTPIEYRYPVKKYYAIKLDLPEFLDEQNLFLNKFNCGGNGSKINYTLDTKSQSSEYQTQFTLKEIEEIIPREDMDKFKLIPVEED